MSSQVLKYWMMRLLEKHVVTQKVLQIAAALKIVLGKVFSRQWRKGYLGQLLLEVLSPIASLGMTIGKHSGWYLVSL